MNSLTQNPHTSHKTYRQINRHTKTLKTNTNTPLLTVGHVHKAIKNSKTNKSTGLDDINIQHLKYLGPIATTYLTKLFNLSLNSNSIPSGSGVKSAEVDLSGFSMRWFCVVQS